jgi:hypothetical protein
MIVWVTITPPPLGKVMGCPESLIEISDSESLKNVRFRELFIEGLPI